MPPNGELDRLTVFATDFARVYARFIERFPNVETVTVEGFADLFNASNVEYLHYAGPTALDKPFFPAITADLLQLSSAYLSLSLTPDVSHPAVRIFGLLLSLFMYATQPARPRDTTQVKEEAVVASTPTNAAAAVEEARSGSVEPTAPSSPPPMEVASFPLRPVPISLGCMRHLLRCMSNSDGETSQGTAPQGCPHPLDRSLTHTEAKALLMLHRAGGWHTQPYVRDANHISALLAAHVKCGVPLICVAGGPQQPNLFAATLAARVMVHAAAPSGEVGGPDSLLRDPQFVQMQQDYDKARQQLFNL